MSSAPAADPRTGTLEADVVEFATLLATTLRALKSAVPPPSKELHDAILDLGARHAPALYTVALAGPLSVSDLARQLGLGLSTTSTIVVELSNAGLVERSEDETDRRRTIVSLHEDHRAAVDAWTMRALAPIHRTLSRLTPTRRRQFIETMQMLRTEAARSAAGEDDADAPPCA